MRSDARKYTCKIITVLIVVKILVPRARCFGQFTAHEPGCILHVEIFAQFSQEPLNRREVFPS